MNSNLWTQLLIAIVPALITGIGSTIISLKKCKNLINNIYSIYSDNDEMNSIKNLEDYADALSAKKALIKNFGHFNPKSNVTEVKEINDIILNN